MKSILLFFLFLEGVEPLFSLEKAGDFRGDLKKMGRVQYLKEHIDEASFFKDSEKTSFSRRNELCSTLLGAAAPSSSWQTEVESIDRQIQELKELKRGYEGRALSNENQAEQLQFIQGELSNAKRYWKIAEDNRAIARKIQEDIEELEKRKAELLKENAA